MVAATVAANTGAVLSRQPTIHLLRSPIVKWLQTEFSVTNRHAAASDASQVLARNRLLRASPGLFISHRPNDNPDNKHKPFTSTRVTSTATPQPSLRSSQQQKLQKKHLERISHHVYTTCSHQLGWRCVPSCCAVHANHHQTTNPIIAAKDRKELWDLSKRTGATNVMAVGSSAAMYLAKSMTTTDPDRMELDHQNSNSSSSSSSSSHYLNSPIDTPAAVATSIQQQRILIPLTYEAVWASTTSHVLLLSHPFSPNEPMLSAVPASIPTSSMVVLDPSSIWGSLDDRDVAYQAAVALALDALYWHLLLPSMSPDNSQDLSWKPILQQWLQQRQQQQSRPRESSSEKEDDDTSVTTTMQALTSMGASTSFGFSKSPPARSIPLAVAVSLLPRIIISQETARSQEVAAPAASSKSDAPPTSSQLDDNDAGVLFLRIMASLVPGLLRLVVSMEPRENGKVGINGRDGNYDGDVSQLRVDLARFVNDSDNTPLTPSPQDSDHKTNPSSSLYALASSLLLGSDNNYGSSSANNLDAAEDCDKLLDIILDLVQENREHWNCQDVDESILEQVVYDSLQHQHAE